MKSIVLFVGGLLLVGGWGLKEFAQDQMRALGQSPAEQAAIWDGGEADRLVLEYSPVLQTHPEDRMKELVQLSRGTPIDVRKVSAGLETRRVPMPAVVMGPSRALAFGGYLLMALGGGLLAFGLGLPHGPRPAGHGPGPVPG